MLNHDLCQSFTSNICSTMLFRYLYMMQNTIVVGGDGFRWWKIMEKGENWIKNWVIKVSPPPAMHNKNVHLFHTPVILVKCNCQWCGSGSGQNRIHLVLGSGFRVIKLTYYWVFFGRKLYFQVWTQKK